MSDFPKNSEKSPTSPIDHAFFDSPNPTREDVAKFLMAHAPMIRRRIRGKLAAMRRRSESNLLAAIDENDIFSTLCQRMDKAVLELKFETLSEPQFWEYVFTTAENAILERLRNERPLLSLDASGERTHPISRPGPSEQPDSPTVQQQAVASLAACIAAAPTPADRHLIELKAKGVPYAAISAVTGRSRDALRTQWCKLTRFLRASSRPPALTTGGLRRSALTTTPLPPPPTRTHA